LEIAKMSINERIARIIELVEQYGDSRAECADEAWYNADLVFAEMNTDDDPFEKLEAVREELVELCDKLCGAERIS
jgi:hypothetical protein